MISYLKLIRAPAGFTALTNILAASVIMADGQLDIRLGLLLIASGCFYFSGMALNDCFDFQEDSIERPSRPIPCGAIKPAVAWGIGIGLLVFGLLFAFSFSATSGYIGAGLAIAILVYNGLVKEGFFGSLSMASCRYLNWLLGASFVALSVQSFVLAIPIFAYITGLTFLSKQETNAQNKQSVWVCTLAILAVVASCIYLIHSVFDLNTLEIVVAYGFLFVWASLILNKLRLVFQSFSPENIQQMIVYMVVGVIPLDALLVAMSGNYLFALIVLALLVPCRMLNQRLNAIT